MEKKKNYSKESQNKQKKSRSRKNKGDILLGAVALLAAIGGAVGIGISKDRKNNQS